MVILVILHNRNSGLYHAALCTIRPFPGPYQSGSPMRYQSSAHQTEGSDLEGAKRFLRNLKVRYADAQTFEKPIDWSGKTPFMLLVKGDTVWMP